jgi:hypothetical protein
MLPLASDIGATWPKCLGNKHAIVGIRETGLCPRSTVSTRALAE